MKELDAYLEAVAGGGDGDAAPHFIAAWERLESAYLKRLTTAIRGIEDWRDRFRAGAMMTVELVERYPHETAFLVVDALAAGSLGRTYQQRIGSRLRELIDTAREELDDPDSVPPATAAWIVGVFFDKIYRRCTGASTLDLRTQLPELLFLGVSAYFGTDAGMEELF